MSTSLFFQQKQNISLVNIKFTKNQIYYVKFFPKIYIFLNMVLYTAALHTFDNKLHNKCIAYPNILLEFCLHLSCTYLYKS